MMVQRHVPLCVFPTEMYYIDQISSNLVIERPSWLSSYGSWIYNYLCNRCLLPLLLWVRIPIKARCTTLCDKVCQWLATGQWFSLDTQVSSTNETDRHDITEILLKGALNTHKKPTNQSNLNYQMNELL